MREMKDRIKALRKALSLTQVEFASKISVRQSTYAGYEAGKSKPSNPAINNICKTFGVNEQWLRTGEGEMFAPKGDSVDCLLAQYGIPAQCADTLRMVLSFPEAAQKAFCDFARELAQREPRDDTALREQIKAELRAEVKAEAKAELRAEVEREVRAEMAREETDRWGWTEEDYHRAIHEEFALEKKAEEKSGA